MGAYLTRPVTDKSSEEGTGKGYRYGASSMQGWRVSQEDAHNCVPDFDTDSSYFAVYDGHGGAEVAVYLAQRFPEFLKNNESYDKKNYKEALRESFLKMDAHLKEGPTLQELQKIAKRDMEEEPTNDQTFDEENVGKLYEEATMPLEKLVANYRKGEDNEAASSCQPEDEKPCSSKSMNLSSPSKSSESPLKTEKSAVDNGDENCTSSAASTSKPESEPSSSQNDADDGTATSEKSNDVAADVASSSSSCSNTTVESQKNHSARVNGESSSASGNADSSTKSGDAGSGSSVEPSSTHGYSTRQLKEALAYRGFLFGNADDSDEDDDESSDGEADEFKGDSDDSDDDNVDDAEEGGSSGEGDEDCEGEDDDDEDDDDDDEDTDDRFLSELQEPGFDSGSTAVVAFIRKDPENDTMSLWVANAGDSRCVICRNGEAVEMSQDHKPEDEAETRRIVNAGGKVTLDGRVNGGLNLSRALGDHSYKQNNELPLEEQMITALPDIRQCLLDPKTDNFIILACDGVWNSMTSQEVVDFVGKRLATNTSIATVCEELFDVCIASDTNGDGTGCDNMTAIIIELSKVTRKRQHSGDEVEPAKKIRADVDIE